MSRNLCRTECYFCEGPMIFEENPRPITKEEAGPYYETRDGYGFAGMVVANAHCEYCEAKYLAWVSQEKCDGYRNRPRNPHGDKSYFDLSFRSSFNDEPGPEDMPLYRIEYTWNRVPVSRCQRCGGLTWPNAPTVCADWQCGRKS